MQPNDYSVSQHYQGEEGRIYFQYQNVGGDQRGRINARKFMPFVQASDSILDFGCGNGSMLQALPAQRRIGVEVNPAARAVAEQVIGLEIHATTSTVADASVDVIVSNHALEHVLDPLAALRDLWRILKPNGHLIVCVPIDDWRTQKCYYPKDVNHHLYTWTPLLLGNLLAEAGYQVDNVRILSHAWPPRFWRQLDAWLPVCAFDLLCRFTAWRLKRRQIIAVASRG